MSWRTLAARRPSANTRRRRARQADAVIDLLDQQRATVADDVSAVERCLHDTASNLAKPHWHIGTLWHWQSCSRVALFWRQIPMTTHPGSGLPTFYS
jgi:hypothetical protein